MLSEPPRPSQVHERDGQMTRVIKNYSFLIVYIRQKAVKQHTATEV